MNLVSIDNIPQIDISEINPFFYKYRRTEEEELNEENRNKIIKEMLNDNPNLWTSLYTYDLIDSSMIPKEILEAENNVPF